MLRLKFGAVALLLTTGIVFAHAGATGVVKERMDGMKSIAANMKTIGTELNSETPDRALIGKAASEISSQSGMAMVESFPKGSDQHPSEASKAIWNDFDEFTKQAATLQFIATTLRYLGEDQDAPLETIKSSFIDLGNSCKDCHQKFRIKK